MPFGSGDRERRLSTVSDGPYGIDSCVAGHPVHALAAAVRAVRDGGRDRRAGGRGGVRAGGGGQCCLVAVGPGAATSGPPRYERAERPDLDSQPHDGHRADVRP